MKKLTILLLATALWCCSFQRVKAQGTEPKNEPYYSAFIDSVPELKGPIEIRCGFENLILTKEQREKLRPFTPAGYEIIGKLAINPNFNLLICGELVGGKYVPYLVVTDSEGTGSPGQKLVEDTCPGDSTYEVRYVIEVISQNTISVREARVDKSSNGTTYQEKKVVFEIDKKGAVKRKKG